VRGYVWAENPRVESSACFDLRRKELSAKKRGLYRFSDHFGLGKNQAELDFVDIPLDTDIRLFVDPYALLISPVDWLRTCGDLVANFFDLVLQSLRNRNEARAMELLSNLHEPNETRLGHSRGKPSGRGWGPRQARTLYRTLSQSRAVHSGKLKDLSDFELLIPGIGNDKISDLTINVIRSELVAYTEEQCVLHGVPVANVPAGVFWNPDDGRWEGHYANLPVFKEKGLILVPKAAVRKGLVPDYQEFYNHYVLNFLQAEQQAASALVRTIKGSNPRIYKKDLKARPRYKLSKEFLFDFVEEHPKVLATYKRALADKAATIIADSAIESRQARPRPVRLTNSEAQLQAIAPGREEAGRFHTFILGILTEIFSPALTRPQKEREIDDGRKRVDILFSNSASRGFFSRLVNRYRYLAPKILVECKNYTEELGNPEFDQLAGRLNRKIGFVGIIVCRLIQNRPLLIKRCQDLVNNDDKKLILVLEDKDICQLIQLAREERPKDIDDYLEGRLDEILLG
jgi:hypothetical protein